MVFYKKELPVASKVRTFFSGLQGENTKLRNEEYCSLRQLFGEVIKDNFKKQSTFFIGIDGCGGSGVHK